MFLELQRLQSLIDYVEATERDRLSIAWDVADHGGFRRFRDRTIKLPGVHLDRRSDSDTLWMVVDRLVRCPPPPLEDAELRLWAELPNDPEAAPTLKPEVPRQALAALALSLLGAEEAATAPLRLEDYPGRARLEAALQGYIAKRWTAWSQEERPRRQSIALYNELFALRQMLDGAADRPVELVWGIGIAHWQQDPEAARLRYPLLTVPMELSLDAATHAIQLRPRSEAPPGIESDALNALQVEGLNAFRSAAEAHFAALEGDGLNPFDEPTYGPVLRRGVTLLQADACYLPDLGDRRPPDADTLTVDDGWVLFERPRAATQTMEDLRRFRTAVEALTAPEEIPLAVRVLLQEPAVQASTETYPQLRGVSTLPGVTSADGSGEDLFFPKPFNREQVEVIQRLSVRSGVVVQGPPGTGKTHTIANIVSHYLALGKRVLVTSQKAPALKVLRDKLPEAVRPLAVSLLESDRDGLRQFQESVDIIADRLQRIRIGEAQAQIAALDTEIEALHRALARIDGEVERVGRQAMTPLQLDGAPVQPAAAARRLVAAGATADWLEDALEPEPRHDPQFDDEAIARLRIARGQAGARLDALDAPPPAELPASGTVLALHDRLVEAQAVGRSIAAEAALAPGAGLEAVLGLEAALDRIAEAEAAVADGTVAWAPAVLARLRAEPEDAAVSAVLGLDAQIEAVAAEGRYFLTRPVAVEPAALVDSGFREALPGLARGEALGLFQSLFARQVKARVEAVRLAGRAPTDAPGWAEVERYCRACDGADRLRAVWNHAAPQAGLDPVAAEGLSGAEAMRRQHAQLEKVQALAVQERDVLARLRRLLPAWGGGMRPAEPLRTVLAQHRRRLDLDDARAALAALEAQVGRIGGALGQSLRAIAGAVGEEASDREALDRDWSAALAEAAALRALQPAFDAIHSVTDAIARSGAPLWAAQLRTQPASGGEDALTPGDWRERWTLRRLAGWLQRIDGHGRLRALSTERTALEDRLRRAYEAAIEARTWCRLAEQASDQVRAALAAYAQAMRKVGRGTGIRAGRYRADARAAADRAKNALPCWIMPHYRVSESLPSELGLFDLVVVDEASQSTVAALPALLRAKQVLIVGDDRQVSPEAGFRQEARLKMLADRHLGGQVLDYRATMREDRSLYDLGTVVFAGGAIMLKEHFRSVAPIIEYSKAQFYNHRLVPLRLPAASQRLDPPLVDILVEDGYRHGKVNPPEVDCIVDEIGRIVADPAMAERSIGVTTLLGQEQAVALLAAIERDVGAEAMVRHDIRVGEPSAFQGDERDIMFVSLVADRHSNALSGLGYEQRFNVAASRARDRMVLVRSVEVEDLRPTDKLRRSLVEHFFAPFAGTAAQAEDRRARCESPFETELFDLLSGLGYRVDTQVAVGAQRIDLVVEGAEDRRLAIECDGDSFHGPERWPDDIARQRMLERAGWTLWRCFASRFVRERAAVMAELVAVLAANGIAPDADGSRPPLRYCEHRRWRSKPLEGGEAVPYAWLMPADPF